MICIYKNNFRNVDDIDWHLRLVIEYLIFLGISHLLCLSPRRVEVRSRSEVIGSELNEWGQIFDPSTEKEHLNPLLVAVEISAHDCQYHGTQEPL
jgi:hypothetical protein